MACPMWSGPLAYGGPSWRTKGSSRGLWDACHWYRSSVHWRRCCRSKLGFGRALSESRDARQREIRKSLDEGWVTDGKLERGSLNVVFHDLDMLSKETHAGQDRQGLEVKPSGG